MTIKDLLPRSWARRDVPVRRAGSDPVRALQSDINRAFQDFWQGFDQPMGPAGWSPRGVIASTPPIDIRDNANEVELVAEMPGFDEGDLDISLADGTIAIRAQKKSEREIDNRGYVLRERSLGSVERVVPLPPGLDLDSAKATFKNGILAVTIPKSREKRATIKHVAVRRA